MEVKIFLFIAIVAASCFSAMAKECRIMHTYHQALSWTVADVDCLVDSKVVTQTKCIRGQWSEGDFLDVSDVLNHC